MDSGSNKSLYTLIAIVIFGIFLSLSYFLFKDQTQGILADVMGKSGMSADSKLTAALGLEPVSDASLEVWFSAEDFVNNGSWTADGVTLTANNFNNTATSGLNGGLVVFDGVNDYISIPHSVAIAPTSALSVEIVVLGDMTKIDRFMYLISKTENSGYALEVVSTQKLRFQLKVNGAYHSLDIPLSELDTKSNHIIGTFDGKTMSLYNNGRLLTLYDFGATYPIDYLYNNSLMIGAGASTGTLPEGGDKYLEGFGIKAARVYSKALTEEEIWQNYRFEQ
jgi:hypothetical protein